MLSVLKTRVSVLLLVLGSFAQLKVVIVTPQASIQKNLKGVARKYII